MKFLLALSLVLLMGCDPVSSGKTPKENFKTIVEDGWIVELEYDGCRYLALKHNADGGMWHKGNCPNPIHEN